jgi:hypothetical protein
MAVSKDDWRAAPWAEKTAGR